jgi:hypothetical protein
VLPILRFSGAFMVSSPEPSLLKTLFLIKVWFHDTQPLS